ncbi:MAG: ATP-binding cassette domain-containing protein [Candidatus Saccharimonas sp.]
MLADIHITEKSFGPKLLMSNIHMSVNEGEKVGIVGRNGIGKSTLFGILTGKDDDYTGDVVYRKGIIIASTAQEHHGVGDISTLEYILAGLPDYAHLRHIISTYPDTMGDDIKKITQYSEALEAFGEKGFYHVEEIVLEDLKHFQLRGTAARPLASLSGGQKRLVEVVKIMHADADLALLDEPTNHMDYIAKQQFISWLKTATQSMLIITHDRDVLSQVDRIIELKDGENVSFNGNYDAYLRQNTQATGAAMNDFEMIEKRIANLKVKAIDYQRLKEKARNPATIQKFKRLERNARAELAALEAIEKPTFWIDKASAENLNYKVAGQYEKFKAKNIKLHVAQSDSRSKRVLASARQLSLGYGDEALFDGVDFEVHEGEVLELRGRNGAGKTTLIHALLHQNDTTIVRFCGELYLDPQARVGVYEQEVSPQYFELTLRDAIERIYLDKDLSVGETKVRQLMSNYLFSESDGGILVSKLSGGQKARLQIISMLANEPQLLILDEPTNHLDLPSIEELETALQKYAGAILYVSHDNYFREKLNGAIVDIGRQ